MNKYARLLLVLCLGISGQAHAQIPVTDGANFTQNVLQTAQATLNATRSLISNANEVTQIQNQVTSLANEARQLASLPLSLVQEIDQAITSYTTLLTQGKGMAYTLQASVQQFEDLYHQGGSGGTFLQRAPQLLAQLREAGRLATQATAVYTRLCDQQTRTGQLMAASQAAVGELQAIQANNQLLGVLAEQQISMQQLAATEQRLQISASMRQLVLEEQAAQDAQQFFGTADVVPIRGPGEGRGDPLPR